VTGAPVLLLHGIQSGPSTWWRVGPDLATLGFDVVSRTVPGNAGTPVPEEGSLASLAAAVVPAVPAVVVGHSLGGLVALELAARHPELVLALVLEDPPSRSTNDPAEIAQEVVDDAAAARSDPAAVRAELLAANPLWAVIDAEHAVANRATIDADHAVDPLLRADWDLGAMAAAVTAPITLLAATPGGSALGGPERDALIAASVRSVVVESGHGIHRDRPGVWVAVVADAATRAFGSETARPGA
jgi:pimeloyl-ACP methyl ester carboxylesterase